MPRRQALSIPSRSSVRERPLTTPRTVLAPVEHSDAAELWQVIEASRDHLVAWLPWVPFNTSLDASRRYAGACVNDWDAGRALRFAIRDRQRGNLLGVVGLDACVHLHRSCDLGYWLTRERCQQGLMSEAAGSCLRFAFDEMGVHRVRCAAAVENRASLGVIGRLGFQSEGVARQAEFVNTRWVDHAVFSRLSTD